MDVNYCRTCEHGETEAMLRDLMEWKTPLCARLQSHVHTLHALMHVDHLEFREAKKHLAKAENLDCADDLGWRLLAKGKICYEKAKQKRDQKATENLLYRAYFHAIGDDFLMGDVLQALSLVYADLEDYQTFWLVHKAHLKLHTDCHIPLLGSDILAKFVAQKSNQEEGNAQDVCGEEAFDAYQYGRF